MFAFSERNMTEICRHTRYYDSDKLLRTPKFGGRNELSANPLSPIGQHIELLEQFRI